ncbi:MAG: DUF4350 domain-containing protein [Candidatus Odinarchaeota archaeon]|nr:DUF4350 domain-containing protein [Candidatus Odinarchaeota archaeon]
MTYTRRRKTRQNKVLHDIIRVLYNPSVRVFIKRLLAIAILLLLLYPVFAYLVPARSYNIPKLSVENTTWEGCSNLKEQLIERNYEVKQLITSIYALKRINYNGVLVILGPRSPYPLDEAKVIKEFVSGGGVLILSDDFGAGNSLGDLFGIHFSQYALIDSLHFERNPKFPVVTDFGNSSITNGVSRLVLNEPSALITYPSGTILAQSSSTSWIDSIPDNKWEAASELKGPLPIAILVQYGKGYIVAISDPSIFINDMLKLGDNLKFALNLFSWAVNIVKDKVIVFDETHFAWEDVISFEGVTSRILGPLLSQSFDSPAPRVIAGIVTSIAIIVAVKYSKSPTMVTTKKRKKRKFLSSYILEAEEFKKTIAKNPKLLLDNIKDPINQIFERIGVPLDVQSLTELKMSEFVKLFKLFKTLLPKRSLESLYADIDSYLAYVNGYKSLDQTNTLMLYLSLRSLVLELKKKVGGG